MTCANRTKGYLVQEGFVPCVGLTPTTAELWGGGTFPTVDVIDFTENITPPTEATEYYENIEANGSVTKNRDYLVTKPNEGTSSMLVYPESMGKFAYSGLGYADLSGPHADGTKYAHIIEIDGTGYDQCEYTTAEASLATANTSLSPAYDSGDRKNRELTRLIAMGPADYKQANCRISTYTISGNQKEPLKVEINYVSEQVDKSGSDSSTWTFTDGDYQNPIQLRQGVLTANDTATGIFDFNITVNKELDSDRYPSGTANDGFNRAEPLTSGPTGVDISFTVETHDSLTWENYRNDDTLVKLKLEFTQPDGSFLGLYLPEVQIKDAVPDPAGGSRIAITAVADEVVGTDPFSTERTFGAGEVARLYSTPFYMIIKNTKNINYMRQA